MTAAEAENALSQELKQTRSLFQAMLQTTGDGILITDASGKVLLHNELFLKVWGRPDLPDFPRDGTPWFTAVVERLLEPEVFLERMDKEHLRQSGEGIDHLELKDGRFLELCSRPVVTGKVTSGRIWNVRNVTDSVQMIRELARSREYFQALFHAALDAILIVDLEGVILAANASVTRLLGFTEKSIRGSAFMSLFPDDEIRQKGYDEFRRNIDAHDAVLEYRDILCADGSTCRSMDITATMIPWEQQQAMMVTLRDNTEQKLAVQKLRESEARYRSLVDNFPNGAVVLFDHDLRFTTVGGLGLPDVGLDPDEMLGKTVWEVFPPETFRQIEPMYRAALAGEIRLQEVMFRNHILEVRYRPIRDPDGNIILGMAMTQNITQRKKAEEQLRILADTDGLTGVYNRRCFMEKTREEIQRAVRYKNPLHLILMDIDHFKQINDTFGHQAGDRVLREFARLCNQTLRPNDIFGRIGGEEFAVTLIQCDRNESLRIAERLRKAAGSLEIVIDRSTISFTISCGVASLSTERKELDALYFHADSALYQAKESGRNRVVNADYLSRR